jgi:hypothetical protein
MLESKDFLINNFLGKEDLRHHADVDGESYVIDPRLMVEAAIKAADDFSVQIAQFEEWEKQGRVVLWSHVLEKNKGGAVGECLASAYCNLLGGRVVKNPHESGSPDFFPLIEKTRPFLEKPKKDAYLDGGFDAKSSKIPDLGFMQIEASSHHRNTSTVLVSGWNYIGKVPHILACFFCNCLDKSDWKIQSIPTNDESKPTSNARLLPSGKHKLRKSWIFLHKSVVPPREKKKIMEYGLVPLTEMRREWLSEPT